MGCGALRSSKTHPAPLSPVSIVPDSPVKEAPWKDGKTEQNDSAAAGTLSAEEPVDSQAQPDEEDGEDVDTDAEDTAEESDESMPGEPMEAKWARAANKKRRLARQRKRAAKRAAKEGAALSPKTASADRFRGIRRPRANPEKEGCFDRQCFLSSSCAAVDVIYDLSINLGKGTFGTVERCAHRKTKHMYAMKTIAKKKVYNPERLAQEVEIMRVLEHPNIVKLHETFEDDKYIYIVMELCTGGELLDRLLSLGSGGFSERAVAKIMRQVVGAVYYMHQQHICHRDLKPENFLLVAEVADIADAHVKVIDFGFSTRFEPGKCMATRAITRDYVAPEILDGSYTEACDIWSLGVVIYVLLSGNKPFYGASDEEVFKKIQSTSYDFEDSCWSITSDDAKDLIRRILVLDASQRLTAEQVLQHQWISKQAPRVSQTPMTPEVFQRLQSFNALGKFKRAAMTAVAQQLQEDAIQQLRQIFQALDLNEDGCLSMQEVKEGLGQAGVEVTSELQRIFELIDTDGSGFVEYTEFLSAAIDEKHHLEEAACWAAFRVFDLDGDGKITKDELAVMLSCGRAKTLSESISADRADIERAIAEADLDGDERLDFKEFHAMLMSCCGRRPQPSLPLTVTSGA